MKKTTLLTAILVLSSISAAQPTKDVNLDLKKTEPTPLQTSEYADIWLEVTNDGTTDANNVEIKFQENYPFSVERGEKSSWEISNIVPGEVYQIHLQTRVDENAVQGNNTLDFTVDSGQIKVEEKVEVEIRSDRNVLSVEEVSFPRKVAPGTQERMDLKLTNLADSQLKNIQTGLQVSSENLPFATSESSTKNIEKVEPGESKWMNYSIEIDEGADNGVYKLPIETSFENEAGTEFEQTTTTGVNIGGKPDIEAGLDIEDPLTSGNQEITLQLVNRGHGSADFVSLKINETEQLEVIGSNQVYIGSMDSDDFQTASFQVYVENENGEVEIPANIEYNDQDGEIRSSQVLEAEVFSNEDLKNYGLRSNNLAIPAAVIAILILAGGFYYWRRRK